MSNISLAAQFSTRIELSLQVTQTRALSKGRALYQPSKAARQAMSVIGASTKLSKEQKRTLTRMIAMVDEYAGGNPKLMRSVVGIANLMAMKSTKNYPPTTPQEMMKMYQEEREKLATDKGQTDSSNVQDYISTLQSAWAEGSAAKAAEVNMETTTMSVTV